MRQVLWRRASLVTLIAWVGTVIGPAVMPHGNVLDLVCSDEVWASPHPTTQIEPVHESVGDVHCVVCHLQRATREAAAERTRAAVQSFDTAAGHHAADDVVLNVRAGDLPARAPPSLLL